MLRIPHCLCQAVAWALPMCQVDTPEASPEASNKGSNSIIFSCVTSFSFMAGALFIAFPIVFRLSKSLVFSLSKLKSSHPRSHSSSLFDPLAHLPGSSSTVYVIDATFEPGVHIWVSRRLCQLFSSDWTPPPSPCVIGSGFHTDWPLPIPSDISHSLANCRLHSR